MTKKKITRREVDGTTSAAAALTMIPFHVLGGIPGGRGLGQELFIKYYALKNGSGS